MVILNPLSSTHSISIIPRYYNIDNVHTLELKDEDTNTNVSLVINNRTLSDGNIIYLITATLNDNRSYRLKISDNTTTDIVFRGKVFTTTQTPQNYQING